MNETKRDISIPLGEGGVVSIVKRAGKAVFGEAEKLVRKFATARSSAVTKPTHACMESIGGNGSLSARIANIA